MINVLFICTGNSARSILAEATLNALGGENFRGFSAGSDPKALPHALALATLDEHGHPTTGLRSKRWDVFAQDDAPDMQAIITVCDNAAGESCPVWPGRPAAGHWGIPDPAAVVGEEDEQRWAFGVAYMRLRARIEDMVTLDFSALSPGDLSHQLNDIGARHNKAEAKAAA